MVEEEEEEEETPKNKQGRKRSRSNESDKEETYKNREESLKKAASLLQERRKRLERESIERRRNAQVTPNHGRLTRLSNNTHPASLRSPSPVPTSTSVETRSLTPIRASSTPTIASLPVVSESTSGFSEVNYNSDSSEVMDKEEQDNVYERALKRCRHNEVLSGTIINSSGFGDMKAFLSIYNEEMKQFKKEKKLLKKESKQKDEKIEVLQNKFEANAKSSASNISHLISKAKLRANGKDPKVRNDEFNRSGVTDKYLEDNEGEDYYSFNNMKAMWYTHTCIHRNKKSELKVDAFKKINDPTDVRGNHKFIVQYFKLWMPGTKYAHKCYESGCFYNHTKSVKMGAQEEASYLRGTKKLAHEKTIADFEEARKECLRRLGYDPDMSLEEETEQQQNPSNEMVLVDADENDEEVL
jgi:hypothetical protein